MVSLTEEIQSRILSDKIHMVDLHSQYLKIKNEIDQAIARTISSSRFIGGTSIDTFSTHLAQFLKTDHVVTCGNGTDALQIALMALDLKKGDEVIVPAFTYVASAEVIALLGLIPIMVDVELDTFNLKLAGVDKLISNKTKAIIPVHLYGQSSDMNAVMSFAKKHNLFVIEDNAQSIGASYNLSDNTYKTGTIGDIGTYSFFPSKNLGAYGDGGALSTNNKALANRIKMIASHGQSKKYHHEIVGVNSRLDSMQAAILDVKLKYLDNYIAQRKKVATYYDRELKQISEITIPTRAENCDHVFHQYTIQVSNGKRDALKQYLSEHGIPSMIYYPLPLYSQVAYQKYVASDFKLANSEQLCQSVLSLPMHTELNQDTLSYIIDKIKTFFS